MSKELIPPSQEVIDEAALRMLAALAVEWFLIEYERQAIITYYGD